MKVSFKILRAGTFVLAAVLSGCPVHQAVRPGSAGETIAPAVSPPTPRSAVPPGSASRLGRPYDIVAGESSLIVLVYRAGALAKAGHNHVIASHDLAGTIYVPADLMRTTFEIRVPVGGLTVDEATIRAQQGTEFTAAVPDAARDGTRRNMLSAALLDVERFTQIVVQSDHLEAGAGGAIQAYVRMEVRQSAHPGVIPVYYEMKPREVVVSGELPLKQTDLGLTPFSALLGALQVQDEMRVKFRLVARSQ